MPRRKKLIAVAAAVSLAGLAGPTPAEPAIPEARAVEVWASGSPSTQVTMLRSEVWAGYWRSLRNRIISHRYQASDAPSVSPEELVPEKPEDTEDSRDDLSIPGALIAVIFGVFGLLVIGRRKIR